MAEPSIRRKFQFTDLKNNNNKFWMVELWEDGTAKTTWGRVGTAPQTDTKQYYTRSDVDKKVREKLDKGYVEVELAKVSTINIAVPAQAMPYSQPVTKYVSDLMEEAGEAIKQFLSVSIESMSLDQIKKGRRLFHEFANKQGGVNKFPKGSKYHVGFDDLLELVQEFYKVIPTQMPHKIDPEEVVKQFQNTLADIEDRLDQLEASVAQAVAAQVNPQAPAGTYDPLNGADLEFVPSNDKIYQAIQAYIKKSSSNRVIDVIKVAIPTERQAFDSSTVGKHNVTGLWHGTANKNGVHILRKGLIIPHVAANGSRFGRGIYFADKAQKSINYTGYSNSKRFRMLFLCDVALGTPWKSGGQDAYMTSAKPGFDSTWGNMSYGGMDEFIVYRPEQQTIRAIVFVER